MPSLFDPCRVGDLQLANRIVMAPLTRSRSVGLKPGPLAVEYYRQRASAGLIISEGAQVCPEGQGYLDTPGIHSQEQVEAWRKVTQAVHAEGGKIAVQLWHVGRISHADFQPGGGAPLSSTARPIQAKTFTARGLEPVTPARALRTEEIPAVVAQFAHAAHCAMEAGFDAVEVHGANGYLIDQFLRDGSNLRDDDYGGPVENRIRLLREVTEALIAVWGKDRVGVRLSPNGETQGVDDSAPEKLFPAAAAALDALGIAFLELREPGPDGTFGRTDVPKQSPAIREAFKGPLILNSDYDVAKAEAALAGGAADAIAFGRPFIGNPDLVERIRTGAEWAADNPQTWYSPGPEGYTDYPALVTA